MTLKNAKMLLLAVFLGLFALSVIVLKNNAKPVLAGESIYDSSFENFLYENQNANFKAYFGNRKNPETHKLRFTGIGRNGAEKSIEMYYIGSSIVPVSDKTSLSETEEVELLSKEKEATNGAKKAEPEGSSLSEKQKELVESWNRELREIEASSSAVKEKLKEIEKDALKTLLEIKRTTNTPEVNSKNGKSVLKQKEIEKGVDLAYSIIPQRGVKEEIIINSLDSYDRAKNNCSVNDNSPEIASISAILESDCLLPPNAFSFILRTESGIDIRKSADGVMYFVTEVGGVESTGDYLFNFEKPWAKDGKAKKITDLDMILEKVDGERYNDTLEASGKSPLQKLLSRIRDLGNGDSGFQNYYLLTIVLPIDWLLSPERVFPITIDQSIVADDVGRFQKGGLENILINNSGELSIAKTGENKNSEGRFTGDPVDLGRNVIGLDAILWEEEATDSAKITVETRSSPDKENWEDWLPIGETKMTITTANSGDFLKVVGKILSRPRRYLQYRFKLESSNSSLPSPVIRNIGINYSERLSGSIDDQMRHGKFFSEGVKQSLWWTGE